MGRELAPNPITSYNGGTVAAADDGVEDEQRTVSIYPLSNYYFGSKESLPSKDHTLARINSKYSCRGLRTCVEAVILVELFKHPHVLILQESNSSFRLPGGRLRPAETDVDGLKRKLSSKLSLSPSPDDQTNWEVGECLGICCKPDIDDQLYPYLPSTSKSPKECTKLYLVRLPETLSFIVPKNLKLLAVPLCQLHQNRETYGEIIAGVPKMLSNVSFNTVY